MKRRDLMVRGGRAGGHSAVVLALVPLVLVLVAVVLAGCGSGSDVRDAGTVPVATTATTSGTSGTTNGTAQPGTTGSTGVAPSTSPTTAVSGSGQVQLSAYFSRADGQIAPVHRWVPRTQAVAAAAVRELLEGPTAQERRLDGTLTSAIPEGSRLLGISVRDKVALVDLSKEFESGGGSLSMFMRLAQVVFTVTQFDSIDRVRFALDGKPVSVFSGEGLILDKPVGRADYEDNLSPILVETPALGDRVSSPLRVKGTANVFEAQFQLELLDKDGKVLVEKGVMATSGSGTRGTFDTTLRFNSAGADEGTLVAFVYSAKDGSRVQEVRIPVSFAR